MSAPAPTRSEQAQASQAGLTVVTVTALAGAFKGLDVASSRSVELFTLMIQALVRRYAAASATLAVHAYRGARAAARVTSAFTPTPAPLPTFEDVQAAVEWAVRDMIEPGADPEAFRKTATASFDKLVQDVGRDTVTANVARDKAARGYARIPEPARSEHGTCAFCLMLAGRGPVYKSETSASRRADGQKYHPGCNCHPVPVFAAFDAPQIVQDAMGMWKTAVKDPGRTGADARAAFRQAVEGRPVTGLTRGPNAKRKAPPKRPEVTPEQAGNMISLFEQSNARAAGNPKLASMIRANDARIAELRHVIAQPLERV